MGEAVVFLSGPGTCFDVVDAAYVFAPGCFTSLLLSVHQTALIPINPKSCG